MARGRMINQTIDYDAEFNALSIEAQLMYLRTLAFLDRDGLIHGHPRSLLSRVCPLLNFTQDQMLDIIDQWVDLGLVIRYLAKVGDVLFFKGFAKNQSGMHYDRESPSRFEPPPGWTHGPKGLVQIVTEPPPTTPQDSNQSDSGTTPTESLEGDLTDSGATPAEVRRDSGATPTQIEVEVKDQDQLKPIEDDEDTRARDPIHAAWFEIYHEEMPGPIEVLAANLLKETSEDAVIHGIRKSPGSDSGSFAFIEKCAKNYIPPAPVKANGNGSYHVDLPAKEVDFMPGVYPLTPPANPSPPVFSPPMAHEDPWSVALSELLPTLSTQAAEWLKDSVLSGESELAGEPFYQVLVSHPKADMQWLKQQLEVNVRRKLRTLIGYRVNVAFVHVAANTPPAPAAHATRQEVAR